MLKISGQSDPDLQIFEVRTHARARTHTHTHTQIPCFYKEISDTDRMWFYSGFRSELRPDELHRIWTLLNFHLWSSGMPFVFLSLFCSQVCDEITWWHRAWICSSSGLEVRSYSGSVCPCGVWTGPERTRWKRRRPQPEPDTHPTEPRSRCGGTTWRVKKKMYFNNQLFSLYYITV